MSTSQFVPGLQLAEGFFRDHVQPLLRDRFPELRYSAGLIGDGSEVLGFDTLVSTDHHWGPRLMIFLRPEDYESRREQIQQSPGSLSSYLLSRLLHQLQPSRSQRQRRPTHDADCTWPSRSHGGHADD